MSGQTAMTPADMFCEMQNSDHTKRAYKNDIKKWYQYVDSVGGGETADNALGFKRALETIYAPSTAQRVWCTVAAYYGWMKGTGKIEDTPFLGIKSPTRPTNEPPPVPKDKDVTALLNACDNGTQYGERARMIVSLLLNGLRAQEVADALLKNVNHDPHNDQWVLNVYGKGEKWRVVPLTSDSQEAIFEFYLNYRATSAFLVPNIENGGKVNTNAIYNTVRFFALKAGIEGMHPHALRHHYATRLVRAGVDVFTLQKLLGHERADTTQRYIGLDYSDLNKALTIDPMHNPSGAFSDSMSLLLGQDTDVEESHDESVPF